MLIIAPTKKIIVKTNAKRDSLSVDIGDIRDGTIIAVGADISDLEVDHKVFFGKFYAECPLELDGNILLSMDEENVHLAWAESDD